MWSIILSQAEIYSEIEKWGLREGLFSKPPEGKEQKFLKSARDGIPHFFLCSTQDSPETREFEILEFLKQTLPKLVISTGARESLDSDKISANPIFVPVMCRRLAGPCDFGGGPLLYQDLKINPEAQATLRKIFDTSHSPGQAEQFLDQTKNRQTLRALSSEYSPADRNQKDWTYVHLFCQAWDPILGDLLLTGERYGFSVGSMLVVDSAAPQAKKIFFETWKKILKDPEFVLKNLSEAHLLPKSSPPASL